MPSRTLSPRMSTTVITMLSLMMMVSFTFRDKTSMVVPLLCWAALVSYATDRPKSLVARTLCPAGVGRCPNASIRRRPADVQCTMNMLGHVAGASGSRARNAEIRAAVSIDFGGNAQLAARDSAIADGHRHGGGPGAAWAGAGKDRFFRSFHPRPTDFTRKPCRRCARRAGESIRQRVAKSHAPLEGTWEQQDIKGTRSIPFRNEAPCSRWRERAGTMQAKPAVFRLAGCSDFLRAAYQD